MLFIVLALDSTTLMQCQFSFTPESNCESFLKSIHVFLQEMRFKSVLSVLSTDLWLNLIFDQTSKGQSHIRSTFLFESLALSCWSINFAMCLHAARAAEGEIQVLEWDLAKQRLSTQPAPPSNRPSSNTKRDKLTFGGHFATPCGCGHILDVGEAGSSCSDLFCQPPLSCQSSLVLKKKKHFAIHCWNYR